MVSSERQMLYFHRSDRATPSGQRILLGQLLMQKGLITAEQLTEALERQSETKGYLGEILLALGILSEADLTRALAEQWDIPFVQVASRTIEAWVLEKIPASLARRHRVLPIDVQDQRLLVAMADPFNADLLDELRTLLNCDIQPMLAPPSQLAQAIEEHYGPAA
jgi:type IV pilus assembly protein PilB